MVLLNVLQQFDDVQLTVAHFDHGIRQDSADDCQLVRQVAKLYGLPFVFQEGKLGSTTSEATARKARYKFLRSVQKAAGATAIITAHHQDDVLETAILNMLRGTGRKGLSALHNRSDLLRPLLQIPKSKIIAYANEHELIWHEDSTNQDPKYLRNYVRQAILPRFDPDARQQLLDLITENRRINHELDEELTNQLHYQSTAHTLNQKWFISLPHTAAREVMASWLRAHGLQDFDRRTLERLTVKAKISDSQQRHNVFGKHWMVVSEKQLALMVQER